MPSRHLECAVCGVPFGFHEPHCPAIGQAPEPQPAPLTRAQLRELGAWMIDGEIQTEGDPDVKDMPTRRAANRVTVGVFLLLLGAAYLGVWAAKTILDAALEASGIHEVQP